MSTITTRAGKGSPLTNNEVDANFTNLNTDKAELSGATFTGEITANGGIALGDNDKATFGSSDDLQIYHSGTHSFIEDKGTGNLYIDGASSVVIRGETANTISAIFNDEGSVVLKNSGDTKLATTSTGIDVTGTATMDGLVVSGAQNSKVAYFDDSSESGYRQLQFTSSNNGQYWDINSQGTSGGLGGVLTLSTRNTERMRIDSSGNVLVGKSGTGFGTAGIELRSNGELWVTTGVTNSASFNRTGNYGAVITINSANTPVGNIGTFGGYQYIIGGNAGGTHAGLRFINNASIRPCGSTGNDLNATLDLGTSAARFKDLYLSGTATTGGLTVSGSTTSAFSSGSENVVATFTSTDTEAQINLVDTTGSAQIRSRNDFRFYVNGGTPLRAMDIASNNDISFYEDTGTTPKLFWDASAESLGIGESSPARNLVVNSGTASGYIQLCNTASGSAAGEGFEIKLDSTGVDAELRHRENGSLTLWTNDTERMRIDSSGNVTIKASGVDQVRTLSLQGTNGASEAYQFNLIADGENAAAKFMVGVGGGTATERMRITSAGELQVTGNGVIKNQISDGNFSYLQQTSSDARLFVQYSQPLLFGTNNTERMRIDASGNLLVGKTATAFGTPGVVLRGDSAEGLIQATRANNECIEVNRTGSDGAIAIFAKDGTTVGSIGTDSGNSLTIGSVDTGFRFVDSVDSVSPFSVSLNAATDGQMNLGRNITRFKDLYLSSGIKASPSVQNASTSLELGVLNSGTTAYAKIDVVNVNTYDTNLRFFTNTSSSITQEERMRIDSSGNLLVGTTQSRPAEFTHPKGISLRGDIGQIQLSTDGSTAMFLNRDTNDGQFMEFRREGAPVGSIGTTGSNLVIGTGDTGFRFFDGSPKGIFPASTSTGVTDGAIDLGKANGRFKDLYLSEAVKIIASTTGFSQIWLGDTADNNRATIVYDHTSDHMSFKVNGSERYRVDSSGNFLVGTTDVAASAGEGIKLNTSSNAKTISTVSSRSTSADEGITMWSTGANTWRFYVGWGGKINATSNTIQAISDQRFKENIRDLDDGLSKVMELRPRKFDWKEGKGADIKDDRGFIAQEFEEVFPDLVGEWKDEAPEGEEPYKAVSQDLIPTLVKAIQEQQTLIESLTARIAALEE